MCLFLSKDAVQGQKFINIVRSRKKDTKGESCHPGACKQLHFYTSNKRLVPDCEGLLALLLCGKHIPTSAALSSLLNHQLVMAPRRGRDPDPS